MNTGPDKSPTADERLMAALCHFSASLAAIAWWFAIPIPGTAMIGPFLVWASRRDVSEFVNRHGREAMNFNLTCAIVGIPLTLLSFSSPGRVILWIAAIAWLTTVVFAASKAFVGQAWKYPVVPSLIR